MDHGSVRFDGADEYVGGARSERCGGGAGEGNEARAGAGDGWQRAVVLFESAGRRDACGGGGGAQRGDLWGAANCGDELFEFWESGKAGRDVAIFAGD